MGKLINIIVKCFGMLGIFLITWIESFLLSIVVEGAVFSLICSVWSFFNKLPALVSTRYGLLLIAGSLPVSFVLCIYLLKKAKEEA